jgi:hypothetical protein
MIPGQNAGFGGLHFQNQSVEPMNTIMGYFDLKRRAASAIKKDEEDLLERIVRNGTPSL